MNSIMTIAAAAVTLAALAAGPARATGTIECEGVAGTDASVLISIGRLPVLAVLNAIIEAEGTTYATDVSANPGAEPITFGQGFLDEDRSRVDFTDPNIEQIVISLRVERAFEDKAGAEAGVLRIFGVGAYGVTCLSG